MVGDYCLLLRPQFSSEESYLYLHVVLLGSKCVCGSQDLCWIISRLLIVYLCLQVREMVEVITREFIQMTGNAGEVINWLLKVFQQAQLCECCCVIEKNNLFDVVAFTESFPCFMNLDGAGTGQDTAQVHVDDEPGVAASYFWRCWTPGSLHRKEKAATWTMYTNKWVLKQICNLRWFSEIHKASWNVF